MLDELIRRLEQPLPAPDRQAEAIVTISQANRERKAAAVALKKLLVEQTKRCNKCEGAGEIFTSQTCMNVRVCPECRGTGAEQPSN